MIELRDLRAGYPGRPVLDGVTLSFLPGEVLAILGPNGCGKSTLLRAAAGLLPISGGEILLDGAPIGAHTPRQIAQRAAYLPQSRPVPSITARRMVLH
ncbi:MAG: ABC transporter ATP-binding protein, partial [Oscillospiraceae bacterium]|nr:ABC transporter ATP-binding protein [Oscillospiraceae bacterium]